jgi:monoamine oxidase
VAISHHASVAGSPDPGDKFAIVTAATDVGTQGRRADACIVSVPCNERGRADVSSPATSGGNDLRSNARVSWDAAMEERLWEKKGIYRVRITRWDEVSAASVRVVIGPEYGTVTR